MWCFCKVGHDIALKNWTKLLFVSYIQPARFQEGQGCFLLLVSPFIQNPGEIGEKRSQQMQSKWPHCVG